MTIEIVDGIDKPRKVKKMIYRNDEWVEQVYVRLIDNSERNGKIEKWCIEHYGHQNGHIQDQIWFKVHRYVMMTDKVYVHYSLVNE